MFYNTIWDLIILIYEREFALIFEKPFIEIKQLEKAFIENAF